MWNDSVLLLTHQSVLITMTDDVLTAVYFQQVTVLSKNSSPFHHSLHNIVNKIQKSSIIKIIEKQTNYASLICRTCQTIIMFFQHDLMGSRINSTPFLKTFSVSCYAFFQLFACRLTPSAFCDFWTCRKGSQVTFSCDLCCHRNNKHVVSMEWSKFGQLQASILVKVKE